MGGQVGENPAARSAAVFSLSSKNLRGRSNTPPPLPSMARVNPRGAGVYPAERAALGGKYYPSANSRTNGRRGTSEAVIESSQHEYSYELLFKKKLTCEVKVRSKVKGTCLWIVGRRYRAISMAGVAVATPTLPVPHQHFALLSLLATPTLTCWLIILCFGHTNFGNHYIHTHTKYTRRYAHVKNPHEKKINASK